MNKTFTCGRLPLERGGHSALQHFPKEVAVDISLGKRGGDKKNLLRLFGSDLDLFRGPNRHFSESILR